MEKQLAALKRLQRIDEQLLQLRSRKEQLPQRVAAAERDVEQRRQNQRQTQQQLQDHRREIDRQELQLRSCEDQIARLRRQLSQVKTNREYQALLTEIQSLEADKGRLEEAVLVALTEVDDLNARLEALSGEIRAAEEEVEAVRRAVAREAEELQNRIADLERDRQAVASLIDPDNLAVYERLHGGIRGRVVVAVRNEHCQGCHMPLTPQTINELLTNRNLITCLHCGRILYLDETPEAGEEATGDG